MRLICSTSTPLSSDKAKTAQVSGVFLWGDDGSLLLGRFAVQIVSDGALCGAVWEWYVGDCDAFSLFEGWLWDWEHFVPPC